MMEKVGGTARKRNAAPAGLQNVLNRLAKLALVNSPCCYYECFAAALESDTDWRTLAELQLAPYVQNTVQFHGDAVYLSSESTSKNETNTHELTTYHHELGDAVLSNFQSAGVCQGGEQWLMFTDNEDHIHKDELTDGSSVCDNPSQFLHDPALLNNQNDLDICHTIPLECCSNNVFSELLEVNILEPTDGKQSFFETSEDHTGNDSSQTQEVTVAVKQGTSVTDSATQLNVHQNRKDSNCSAVQTGSSEIHSTDHDRYGLDSEHFPNQNVIPYDTWCFDVSGDEYCKEKDICDTVTDDRRSAEVETSASEVAEVDLMWYTTTVSHNCKAEETSNYVIADTERDCMMSSVDCENSRFMDIPVESRAQHVKLVLDSGEMEIIRTEDRLSSSLFGCMSNNVENMSKGLSTAVVFQQNSNCLKAGIYASSDRMDLHDDKEITPAEDGKAGTMYNRQDTKTICDMNNANSVTNLISLSNNYDLLNAGTFDFFGGVELHEVELIPTDDEKTDTVPNWEGPETICTIDNYSATMKTITSYSSDIDGQVRHNNEHHEFSHSLELHQTASTASIQEELETVPTDNNGVEGEQQVTGDCDTLDVVNNSGKLAQPSDSGIRLALTPYCAPTSDQIPQYASRTHDQEKMQHDLVLTYTVVCNFSNEQSELTDITDKEGRTATAADSETTVPKMQTVDKVVSLETTAGTELTEIADSSDSSAASEMIGSTKGQQGNNSCSARDIYASSSCADQEFHISAGFSEHITVSTVPNTEGLATICNINNYSDTLKTITGYGNDTDDQAHCSDNEQLESTHSLDLNKTASTASNEEQLETVPTDNSGVEVERQMIGEHDTSDVVSNSGELAQQSDSGVRLPLTPERLSTGDQMPQYRSTTHDVDQEKFQHDLTLTHMEVCNSSDENSQPADIANKEGRTATAAGSVKSVTEVQTVDMVVSLETTTDAGLTEIMDLSDSSTALQMVHSHISRTENLEDVMNEQHENNSGCARSVDTGDLACAHLKFHVDAGFSESNTVERCPDLPLLNNEKISSTIFYAHEAIPFAVYEESDKQLELFSADDLSAKTRRLELDDLTLTVTCFIPEENEELILDDDVCEHVNDSEYFEATSPSSSSELPANESGMSCGLATHMDNNLIRDDKVLPRCRSSEFVLPYLMPIDETAEFTDDANADISDNVHDKSHSPQPTTSRNDRKTEPSNNDEQQMAYNISASPTVEHAYLHHELGEKIQYDDVAARSGTGEHRLGNAACNVYGLRDTAALDNEHKTKSSDDKEQMHYEESHSVTEHPIERNDDSVHEKESPVLWFSANQQVSVGQEVGMMNKYFTENSVATAAYNYKTSADVPQVNYLLHDNNEHDPTTLAINLISKACCKDNATDCDDAFTMSAADAMQQSSSIDSGEKTAESNMEHVEYKDNNSEHNKTVGLDKDTFSSDQTVFGENSVDTHSAELKFNNESCKPSAETALQLCERPVLQSNNVHTITDAINHIIVTAGEKQQTTNKEHCLSQMDTNDTDACHRFAPASPAIVKAPMEIEEPAVDALTDFQSTLEKLHSRQNTAPSD